MKINKLKFFSLFIYCLLNSLWLNIQCCEETKLDTVQSEKPYKRSKIYNTDEFKDVCECAEDYAQRLNLEINPDQCCIFDNSPEKYCKASSGLFYCPPNNAFKIAVKLDFDLDKKTAADWKIVYHATSCNDAFQIAKEGFCPEKTRNGKHYGPGSYFTPSWAIASHIALSDNLRLEYQNDKSFGTVLQCRIRPNSFTENQLTWGWGIMPTLESDFAAVGQPAHSIGEILVPNPKEDVIVYGILFVTK